MKRLQFWSVVTAITLCLGPNALSYAAKPTVAPTSTGSCAIEHKIYSPDQVTIVGADPQSKEVKELLDTYNDLAMASTKHSIEDILKHYTPQFISGDNLTLDQMKNLILETWKAYPDICYDSKPVEIRVNGDWAAVETMDHSTATAPPDKDIMNTPGKLTSDSRSVMFFRHVGDTWEVTSDVTLWEQATIRYGIGDDVQITLSTPEQVKGGETYSAVIKANVPDGTFSIVTIDNQPLTYPHEKVDDSFRTLGGESNELQRVLKANSKNRNELVTATLGLTNVVQKNPERPSLAVNGIATIVKRVNVVPISAEDVLKSLKSNDVVKTSADGRIRTDGSSTAAVEDDSQSYNLELAPPTSNPQENKQAPAQDEDE